MRVAVIGSGLQAKAVCHDLLLQDDVEELHLADNDASQIKKITDLYQDARIKPAIIDAADSYQVSSWLKPLDAVLSAAPYHLNYTLAEAAVVSKTSFCDLGGNNDIIELQRQLHGPAKLLGVSVIPATGLAPGLPAVLAADVLQDFDVVDSLEVRVGGLPQDKNSLLGYSVVFSVKGLVNEYVEPARVLRNGTPDVVESLTGLEELRFPEPIGDLEAFVTSGALATLPDTLSGRIQTLNYKTIRYPGHAGFFTAMKQLGLLSSDQVRVDGALIRPRRVFEILAPVALGTTNDDLIIMRGTAVGSVGGHRIRRTYELVDYPDCGLTAMMRCTAFPAAITLLMLGRGEVSAKGFAPIETSIAPKPFLKELVARGIRINISDDLG